MSCALVLHTRSIFDCVAVTQLQPNCSNECSGSWRSQDLQWCQQRACQGLLHSPAAHLIRCGPANCLQDQFQLCKVGWAYLNRLLELVTCDKGHVLHMSAGCPSHQKFNQVLKFQNTKGVPGVCPRAAQQPAEFPFDGPRVKHLVSLLRSQYGCCRWWEGRIVWGAMLNITRCIQRQVCQQLPGSPAHSCQCTGSCRHWLHMHSHVP